MRLRVSQRQLEVLRRVAIAAVPAAEVAADGHLARVYRGLLARTYVSRTLDHFELAELGREVLRRHVHHDSPSNQETP